MYERVHMYSMYVCVYCIIACLCAHVAGYVDTKYTPSWCPNVLLHLYMVMAKCLSISLRHGLEATFCRDFTWAVDVLRWNRHFRGFILEGYNLLRWNRSTEVKQAYWGETGLLRWNRPTEVKQAHWGETDISEASFLRVTKDLVRVRSPSYPPHI